MKHDQAVTQLNLLNRVCLNDRMTYTRISQIVRDIAGQFSKADFRSVAAEFLGLPVVKSTTKKAMVEWIERRIHERKESWQRTQFFPTDIPADSVLIDAGKARSVA